jgi:hypothetical protein
MDDYLTLDSRRSLWRAALKIGEGLVTYSRRRGVEFHRGLSEHLDRWHEQEREADDAMREHERSMASTLDADADPDAWLRDAWGE